MAKQLWRRFIHVYIQNELSRSECNTQSSTENTKESKKKSESTQMHEHEFAGSVSASFVSRPNSTFILPNTPAIAELICRESRKLEKQMRTQFRKKARIERSNQQVLVRQEINREKRAKWENKLVSAEAQKVNRGRVLKLINNARVDVHETLTSKVSLAIVRRKEAMMARQIEAELRIEKNLRLKEDSSTRNTDAWVAKYDEVRERVSQKEESEAKKAEELLAKIRESTVSFQTRKERYIELNRLRGEGVNLRLIEAFEKKEKQDLDESKKLQEISTLIRQEDERGLAEQFTKAEIIKRRKAVSEVSRLTASFTPLIDSTPGPADYIAPNPNSQGATFGKSEHTSHFDIHASDTPAPGEYNPRILSDGTRPWNEEPVLSFGTSLKTSYLDEQQKHKRHIPGPASYEISPRPAPNTAPKIVPNLVPKSRPVATPGPGSYTLDTFMRTEKIVRAVTAADMFKNLFTVPTRSSDVYDYDLEI